MLDCRWDRNDFIFLRDGIQTTSQASASCYQNNSPVLLKCCSRRRGEGEGRRVREKEIQIPNSRTNNPTNGSLACTNWQHAPNHGYSWGPGITSAGESNSGVPLTANDLSLPRQIHLRSLLGRTYAHLTNVPEKGLLRYSTEKAFNERHSTKMDNSPCERRKERERGTHTEHEAQTMRLTWDLLVFCILHLLD